LKVVALIDPFVDRSVAVLKKKRASFVASAYKETLVCKTPEEFAAQMTNDQHPMFILVGCPPAFRGSDEPGRDLEIRLLKLFPGTAMFVEKPVSCGDIEKVKILSIRRPATRLIIQSDLRRRRRN
jgi:hypothetical protein